jgi:SAM-dependent methyltransferase
MNSKDNQAYQKHYKEIWASGLQYLGGSLITRSIFNSLRRLPGQRILEIGAGSGESLNLAIPSPRWDSYVALDLAPGWSDPELYKKLTNKENHNFGSITFVEANAQKLPFPDDFFDAAISTCVLAHIADPEEAIKELRRVVRHGGQVVIGMPTDPGMLNRLVKLLITYPKMRKFGSEDPRLEYAREHPNGIGNLLALLNHHFLSDKSRRTYYPFIIPSWNCNLFVLFNTTICKK